MIHRIEYVLELLEKGNKRVEGEFQVWVGSELRVYELRAYKRGGTVRMDFKPKLISAFPLALRGEE
jgi:hypothetical protein